MTITLVLPQPPAYSETFFRSKIKGLHESGHEVVIATASTKRKFNEFKLVQHPKVVNNVMQQLVRMAIVFVTLLPYAYTVFRYIQLEKKENTNLKRIIEKIYLNASLLKLKTDWLHFGYATMAIDRELVAKAIRAKMGVSLRGSDIMVYPIKHHNCFQQLWKQVDQVHSNSNFLYQRALALGLSKNKPIQIITPAVEITKTAIYIDVKTKNKKLKLLTVARLHWVKGIDDVITTANHLKQANINFEWFIVGDAKTSNAARYLYHVHQLKLHDKVIFLGKKEHQETKELMLQADIYVQTSLSEGFCNAVLEAQTLGKLCVAYDVGALNENIVHNETGFLVSKLQPKLLADKIIEVLHLEATQKQKIQKNAMLRAETEFSLYKQRKEWNEFYDNKI